MMIYEIETILKENSTNIIKLNSTLWAIISNIDDEISKLEIENIKNSYEIKKISVFKVLLNKIKIVKLRKLRKKTRERMIKQ